MRRPRGAGDPGQQDEGGQESKDEGPRR
jgi:hypothetical protein